VALIQVQIIIIIIKIQITYQSLNLKDLQSKNKTSFFFFNVYYIIQIKTNFE
jgi:hypothetical protein